MNHTKRYRASLIDRLIDEKPEIKEEPHPSRTLSWEELKCSIYRDLNWLFNTRNSLTILQYLRENLNILNYGIPSLTHLSPYNEDDMDIIVKVVQKALKSYESRIDLKEIRINSSRNAIKRVYIYLNGSLLVDTMSEPISFRISYDFEKGDFQVNE